MVIQLEGGVAAGFHWFCRALGPDGDLGYLDSTHTQTDLDHYWRAVNEARRRSIEGILDPVPVVVRGRVETKLLLFMFKQRDGMYWGNGYGRFRDFPALIHPIRVTMIER